jgi:phage tail tape-measure protein
MLGSFRWVRRIVAVLAVTLASGCGSNEPDRTQGTAAGGAATGAAFGLIGGPVGVVVGAVIGGGAGALAGASTSPQDLDLGAPPWSDAKQTN